MAIGVLPSRNYLISQVYWSVIFNILESDLASSGEFAVCNATPSVKPHANRTGDVAKSIMFAKV
jgi:hypothetical protein